MVNWKMRLKKAREWYNSGDLVSRDTMIYVMMLGLDGDDHDIASMLLDGMPCDIS
jgi:hypothetical protein